MKTKFLKNIIGSSHIAVLVAIIVVSVIVFSGYKIVNTNKHKPTTTAVQEVNAPTTVATPADLKQAENALNSDDQTKSLNTDELGEDISNLL